MSASELSVLSRLGVAVGGVFPSDAAAWDGDTPAAVPFYSARHVGQADTQRATAAWQRHGVDARIFSNLWPAVFQLGAAVEIAGVDDYDDEGDASSWPSTEHYFQMAKFGRAERNFMLLLSPRDVALYGQQRLTVEAKHARIADSLRQRGQAVPERLRVGEVARPTPLASNWSEQKLAVMYRAVHAKFSQHEPLARQLLATSTAWLIEHTPVDRQWADGGDGAGTNFLGKLLMLLRHHLATGHDWSSCLHHADVRLFLSTAQRQLLLYPVTNQ